MRVFCDTSVLVAASEASHPHHVRALPALRRIAQALDEGFAAVHSIAEMYAALTRIPVQPRIHPTEAARIVEANLVRPFTLVSAGRDEYLQAMTTVQTGGWPGAKIYDALLLACAARCDAERIYTFNLHDFQALAPAALLSRICSP